MERPEDEYEINRMNFIYYLFHPGERVLEKALEGLLDQYGLVWANDATKTDITGMLFNIFLNSKQRVDDDLEVMARNFGTATCRQAAVYIANHFANLVMKNAAYEQGHRKGSPGSVETSDGSESLYDWGGSKTHGWGKD